MRSGRRVRSGAQALVVTFVCLTAIHYSSTLTQGARSPGSAGVVFGPTVPNTQSAPARAPKGMAWIPGGEFSMGAQDPPEMAKKIDLLQINNFVR